MKVKVKLVKERNSFILLLSKKDAKKLDLNLNKVIKILIPEYKDEIKSLDNLF